MGRVADYSAVRIDGFQGGLNNHVDASRLEPNELSHAMNVRLGPRGEVQLRSGYTRYDDESVLDTPSFLYPWREADGDDWLLAIASPGSPGAGRVWAGKTTTFADSGKTLLLGSSLPAWGVGFASAEGKAYLSAKHSSAISFDGTTWADVAAIPRGKMLWYRHGRMFSINSLARSSAIYYSDLNDVETWPVTSYIECDSDDGYEINCSDVFGDDLLLFKDHGIWKLSGRTPTSFLLYKLDSLRGSVSPRAFAQLRGRLFFFDRDTGIWAFDGAGFELVSQPINDYLLAGQRYDDAWYATATVGEDRVYFSIPWTGTGDVRHTFVYFGDTQAWTEYDTGFPAEVLYLDSRYITLPGVVGIYNADTASDVVAPSETPIVGTFRTGWLPLGGPGVKARVKRIEFGLEATNSVSLTVKMFRDFSTTALATRTVTGGPDSHATGAGERTVVLDGWGGRLHHCQFEFSTDDYPCQVNSVTIFYTGGVDVLGER